MKLASYIISNMLSPPICQEQYKHYETNGDRSPEKNHTLFAYPTLARLAKESQNLFEVALLPGVSLNVFKIKLIYSVEATKILLDF